MSPAGSDRFATARLRLAHEAANRPKVSHELQESGRLGQIGSFAAVGLLCTGVQYAILALLHGLAGWPGVPASGLGYLAGAVLSYALNYRFSFTPARSPLQGLWRYALVVLAGLACSSLCLAALLALGAPLPLAQLLTTAIVFVFNFTLSKRWAFDS